MVQLLLSGLSADASEADLKQLLSGVDVSSLEIIRDLTSGESRGYAVIRLADDQTAAEISRRFDASNFKGHQIHISRMPVSLPGEMAARDWLHANAT